MGELERLARSVSDTLGLGHLGALEELRLYLAKGRDAPLVWEILNIPERRLIKALLEVKPREPLLSAALERSKQLQFRRNCLDYVPFLFF